MERAARAGRDRRQPGGRRAAAGAERSARRAGAGRLLRAAPGERDVAPERAVRSTRDAARLALGLPGRPCARHVLGGGGAPEHRLVTVAFVRFGGTDALDRARGPDAAAEATRRAASTVVQDAADGARGRAARLRRRRRRRQARCSAPARRARSATRRSGCCATLRAIAERGAALPVADRRPPRARVHRRHRARLPPHLHGDGRRREPRRAADGRRRRRAGSTRRAGVLDRSATRFALHPAPAARAQGQGAARSRRGRSARRVGAHARRAAAGARRRARRPRRGARRPARRAGRGARAATAATPSCRARRASARRAWSRRCAHEAAGLPVLLATCEAHGGASPYAPWRELLVALVGARLGGAGRRGARAAARAPSPSARPTCAPWLPLLAVAVRARGARHAGRRRSWRPPSAPTACTTRSSASSRRRCPSPRCS